MKILQLCKKFPYPLKDGESMAVTYLAQAMDALGHQVTLCCMNTTKHYVDVGEAMRELTHYQNIHESSLDNALKPMEAFFNLFSRDSYNISRFESQAFSNVLKEVLARSTFDIIQLESLYLMPYIDLLRAHSDAPIVLRAHNVEHEIWERMSQNEARSLRRWYLDYTARKLKRYELSQINKVDCLVAISELDQEKFRSLGYEGISLVLPIGLDVRLFPLQQPNLTLPLSISFIGSLDWMPNIEGVGWFLDHIWPSLRTVYPGLTLHIAGRNCPDWLFSQDDLGIVVHGEVESSRVFLTKHPITVVPLLSGSGTRVKILEAMALGRIVLSTTLGAEGIPVVHKSNVLLADKAEDFVEAIGYCLGNKESVTKLSLEARHFVEERYAHEAITLRYLAELGVLQKQKLVQL